MITNDEINGAYECLKSAQGMAFGTAEIAINLKAEFEKKKLAGFADGTIDGKNQTLRDAAVAQMLEKELTALDAAEVASRGARHELELAKIEVSRVQALLRLMEL